MKKVLALTTVLTLMLSTFQMMSVFSFAGGNGTKSSPFQISTVEQLIEVGNKPDKEYMLVADIDLSAYGFTPIGTSEQKFTGSFNGNGFVIKNLNINTTLDNVGLFGYVGETGVLNSICIEDANVQGNDNIGILAGMNEGTVSNCSVTGYSNGASNVGGLIGNNNKGIIANSYSTAYVNCSIKTAGGLVGASTDGKIQNCYSTGGVSGDNKEFGGLIGSNKNTVIENCYYNRNASYQASGVGVGSDTVNGKSAEDLMISTTYEGWDFGSVWGIIPNTTYPYLVKTNGAGTASDPYKIRTSEQLRNIKNIGTGEKGKGKVFVLMGDIEVWGSWEPIGTDIQPFTGTFDGRGVNIKSTIQGGGDYSGAFGVVDSEAVIKNVTLSYSSFSAGNVAGGIAAKNSGTIQNCIVTGYVSGNGKDIGGIAGENGGLIENCVVSASIRGNSSGTGGLVGYNNKGTIRNSYSSGSVSGRERSIGGIAGDNSFGLIENCYSISEVNAHAYNASVIGGLAGRNYEGVIKNSYFAGTVGKFSNSGGLVGEIIDNYTIQNCYFDSTIAKDRPAIGSVEDTGEFGRTSAQMKAQGTYAGWDFNNIWSMTENQTLPVLTSISGKGTKENPYKIRTAEDLNNINNTGLRSMSGRKYYQVMNNIDISSVTVGLKDNPFAGSFDGQGYNLYGGNMPLFQALGKNAYIGNVKLSSMYVSNGTGMLANTAEGAIVEHCTVQGSVQSWDISVGGLIGYSSSSKISNCIALVNTINGNGNVGGLVGQSVNGTSIKKCMVTGQIIGTSNVGGLVGANNASTIENAYSLGMVTGSTNTGGLVGRNDNGATIRNCYSLPSVSGDSNIGGLVGANYANVEKSYSNFSDTTYVNNAENTGLFAGQNDGAIKDSYYLSREGLRGIASAEQDVDGVSGKTEAEMKAKSTFVGWDFNSQWEITDSVNMPYFNIVGSDKLVKLNEPAGLVNEGGTSAAPVLSDIGGHWAEVDIGYLVAEGVINGYDDGTYRPENAVTKAEFIKLLLQAKGTVLASGDTPYTDVNGHWAKTYIYTATTKNLTTNINVSNTIFGADEPITRMEAAAIMGRLINPNSTDTTLNFTDAGEIPDWAKAPLATTVKNKLILGYPDGTFGGGNGLTRAESAVIIKRVMGL